SHGSAAGGQVFQYQPALVVYPPAPLEPGKAWTGTTSLTGFDLTLSAEVLGLRGVATPAGRFNAFLIRQPTLTSNGGQTVLDIYFVPAVGILRFQTLDGTVFDLIGKSFWAAGPLAGRRRDPSGARRNRPTRSPARSAWGAAAASGGLSAPQHLAPQLVEPVVPQRLADALHEPRHEAQVMYRRELLAELLVGLEEVAQVGAGVVGAGVAVAAFLDGPQVAREARVVDVDAVPGVHAPLRAHVGLFRRQRQQGARARAARGHHAVERVHAALDGR